MISTALRRARVNTRAELGAALLFTLSYPCLLLAALLPHYWVFAAAAAVSYLTDWWLTARNVRFIELLSKLRAGVSLRSLSRELMLVLLLSRMALDEGPVYLALACFLLFYGMQAPHTAMITLVRKRRALPVVTRNIPLSWVNIPDSPPRMLVRRHAEKMLSLDVPAFAGLLVTAATGVMAYGYAGAAATLVLGGGYLLCVAVLARRMRALTSTAKVLDGVDAWLREYQPRVVLYFSGSRTSAYQVNMWLDTLAQLTEKPLVILRERHIVPQLSPTPVPVLCVPSATYLMNMDLSSVRVALYPANVGKNIHMLRVPHIQHVFIGHGDSDKIASVNPYSKVYDEVWTAGRAGRDRYALADVGVRDEDIVEVGRPQLGGIRSAGADPAHEMPTVLYAPTWEGWTDDPGNTSVILAGENIVRTLVEAEPAVRVLYKPHPFTGTRSPLAKAAHERVLALIASANGRRAADPQWRARAAETTAEREAAAAELRRIQARLAELERTVSDDADEAAASRDSFLDPEKARQVKQLREEWNAAYWKSLPTWEHQVVTGPQPHLYDCFNESDLMVSDISSVVSDFIASGKPYAITDTAGLGEEEFKRQNSAARAAYILTPDASGLPQVLQALGGGKDDPLAKKRRTLKQYLLGPDNPPSMTRFDQAVRELAEYADERLAGLAAAPDAPASGGVNLPQQRGTSASQSLSPSTTD